MTIMATAQSHARPKLGTMKLLPGFICNARAQTFGPSSAAFPGVLAERQVRSGGAGLEVSSWDTNCHYRKYIAAQHCRPIPAPSIHVFDHSHSNRCKILSYNGFSSLSMHFVGLFVLQRRFISLQPVKNTFHIIIRMETTKLKTITVEFCGPGECV